MNLRLLSTAALVGSLLFLSSCTSILYKMNVVDCAPVYGNWCGENYPISGYDPDPVDEWDSACRDHDHCYGSSQDKRSCDDELLEEFERLSYQQLTPQRMYNAYEWFKRNGYVGGWVEFTNETWGLIASCK